ncbi:MAG: hypothetical protein ACI4QI_01900, partial [Candidatus Coproplasma sp.]
ENANVEICDEQLDDVTGGVDTSYFNGPATHPHNVRFKFEVGQVVHVDIVRGEFDCEIIEKFILSEPPYYFPAYKLRDIKTGTVLKITEGTLTI